MSQFWEKSVTDRMTDSLTDGWRAGSTTPTAFGGGPKIPEIINICYYEIRHHHVYVLIASFPGFRWGIYGGLHGETQTLNKWVAT